MHLDLDAFFCAVKEQRDPTVRGKAFAVGGRPETGVRGFLFLRHPALWHSLDHAHGPSGQTLSQLGPKLAKLC